MADDDENAGGAPAITAPGTVAPTRKLKRKKSDDEATSEKKKESKMAKITGPGGALAFTVPPKQPEPVVKLEEMDPAFDIIKFNIHESNNGEVTIAVFSCHRRLAIANSTFLRDIYGDHAVNGLVTSVQRPGVDIKDSTSVAFSIVMRYFYTGKIRDDHGQLPHPAHLIAAWILGARLAVPKLQNLAILGIEERRAVDNTVQTDSLQTVYHQTAVGSPLRRLMVDHVAFRMEPVAFEVDCRKNPGYYPWELLLDVAAALKHGQTSETKLLPNMELFLVPE